MAFLGVETWKEKKSLRNEYNCRRRVSVSVHSQKGVKLFLPQIYKKNTSGIKLFKI